MTDMPTLILRGAYSTIRAEHEDAKKEMQMLCGKLQSFASQVLRKMQPDNDAAPENVDNLIFGARNALADIEACAANIESLAKQRAELKKKAWP